MYRLRRRTSSTPYAQGVPTTRASYHHGALREALLKASLQLIEAEGIGAVSLRRVAREAGVSPGAPYHHFPDRASLLAALSAQGQQLLARELEAARDAASTPVRALTALIAAYVRFAQHHPGYFRLMFRPELSDPQKHPEAKLAEDAAGRCLEETVAECVRAGVIPPRRADALAVTAWSLGHGLASLWLDGELQDSYDDLATLIAETTSLLEWTLRSPAGRAAGEGDLA
jgi:AcrR family transcriptional regulator